MMTELTAIRWAYDRTELIADGVIHVTGVAFSLIASTALIFYATAWGSAGQLAAAWVYSLGLVLTLTMSASYNIWPVSPTKWILRRLDHSAIFLLIAATYTPFLARMGGSLGYAMLAFIWALAAAGVALKCLFPGRYHRLAIFAYLAMGWSGVLIAKPIAENIPFISCMLIVVGGVIYSLGVIFHVWEKLRFQNAIWHAFVLVAAIVHYSAVFTCLSTNNTGF